MAFFCPGSSVKIKKEIESSKNQRPTQLENRHHHSHASHSSHRSSSGRVAPYSTGRVTDKVQAPSPTTPIGNHFIQKMVVVQDFQPQEERDLLVRKGERVEVICREDDWLLVRNERGREGYIPKKNCVPPVSSTKRTTPRSYRPLPIRPVGSTYENTTEEKKSIPLYSSSSAGHPLQRYNSPMTEPGITKLPMHRITSPSSHLQRDVEDSQEGSSSTLDPKHSPSSSSGVASLTDPYSPALNHNYSPDDLKSGLDSSCSLTTSITTNSSIPLENGNRFHHRKHSGSDDSGTEVAITTNGRGEDYASTLRCGDSSSEDGSTQRAGSSMRDRPLPSPPSQQPRDGRDTPPPVPPRHTSLDRHAAAMGLRLPDEQYASPVDSLRNGPINDVQPSRRGNLLQQTRVKSLLDITAAAQDNGTYSEVFQSTNRPQRRQTLLANDNRENGGVKTRRSASFHRNYSAGALSLDRRSSPGRGADKKQLMETVSRQNGGTKHMTKFRKYLWGVYVAGTDFEGVDENEVCVKEGEHVLVFNQDDQDWFWVVKHKTDNSEGFVPSYLLKEFASAESKSVATRVATAQTRLTPPVDHYRGRTSSAGTRPINKPQPVHIDRPQQPRPRIKSAGSRPGLHKSMGSSMEKVPLGGTPLSATPSSPPPPYQELDPLPHYSSNFSSSQPDPSVSGMSRTQSQSVRVNRYHRRPMRTNTTPQLAYSTRHAGLSGSSQQLMSPLDIPSYSYPTTPTSPNGGTLV